MAEDILSRIVAVKHEEVAAARRRRSLAAVRADAEDVQAQLCPDGSVAMTSLPADAEVDFARNQLALARSPKLAPRVKRLGLTALLDEIERRRPVALAEGREGAPGGGGRLQLRPRRLRTPRRDG